MYMYIYKPAYICLEYARRKTSVRMICLEQIATRAPPPPPSPSSRAPSLRVVLYLIACKIFIRREIYRCARNHICVLFCDFHRDIYDVIRASRASSKKNSLSPRLASGPGSRDGVSSASRSFSRGIVVFVRASRNLTYSHPRARNRR